jgi:hypothetical protein
MSWDLRFRAPIAVPRGMPLVTLRDAATHITNLPAETQQEQAWQNAVHVLLQAADYGGPVEFARLGMVQALYPKPPRFTTPSRRTRSGAMHESL